MKNRLLALAAAALLSGTAAVSAQDNTQAPKSPTKDQIARPDAQPGPGEDRGSAGGADQDVKRNIQRTQVQDRDRVQGEERGPQGGEMLRGGEMRSHGHPTLTVEQKTNLRETVFKVGPKLTHVSFHVGVGVHVPRTVRLVAVPQEIVSIYPDWSGDLFFTYGDEIVVVAPGTMEIVGVLPL